MMQKILKQTPTTYFSFGLAVMLVIVAIFQMSASDERQKRLSVQNIASSHVNLISNSLHQAISSTYPLAAMVRKQQGQVTGFRDLAIEMLPYYPSVSSLQLAPDGILQYIEPITNNTGAIGHDLFSDPSRRKEAHIARDTGILAVAGPFNLVQGGVGIAARLPIFINKNNTESFWGFSIALIRLPQLLKTADLDTLVEQGIDYELSRINPDNGAIDIFASSAGALADDSEVFFIDLPNGLWKFKASPQAGWINYQTILLNAIVGILILVLFSSLLILVTYLRTNEKRLNLALKAAKQGWYEINLHNGEIIIDDNERASLGFAANDSYADLRSWQKHIHPDDYEQTVENYKQCLKTGETTQVEYRRQTANGSWVWMHAVGEVVEWDRKQQPKKIVGVYNNITRKKQVVGRDKLRSLVLEQLVAGKQLTTILTTIVTHIEELSPFSLCSILLMDREGKHLLTAAAPSLPDFYNDAVNGFAIGPEAGSCGSSAYNKSRSIAEDIQTHPHWRPFAQLAEQANLRACWSDAILGSNDKVLGTFAIYHAKPCLPSDDDLELISAASKLAAIVIERTKFNEQIQLLSRAFKQTHDGIMITDADQIIVDINPAFCEITGFSRDDAIGQSPNILNSGKQTPQFYENVWQTVNEQHHWQGEIWNRKKDGSIYAELLTISTLLDEQGLIQNYVGIFSDITQSKQQQEKLNLMAHYDVLTELPNRALFNDRFNQAIAHSQRTKQQLAICFLDLDDFKTINDQFGHTIGDQVLIEVAQRTKAQIRAEDTVSRQGGDEFALLLSDIESYEQCELTLERILKSLSKPYLIEQQQINISASIGVSLYPADHGDIDTLLRHADQAMYQAKLAGKNRYHLFDHQYDQQIVQKNHRLSEVEQALTNNELQLYYQPKVNMVTGEIFGAEALIRWIHPEKGLIPPNDFLPLIDGTELECQVGDWVIHQALQQLDSWQKQGIKLEVSVNISSYHLQSEQFLAQLNDALAMHPSVNSQDLQLEILESSALGDLNTISRIIQICQGALGVNMALDDFGTGYSSLTHLRNLPVNTIKIDQTFIRDLLDDPGDFAIVDGVIGLADSFHRNVIAEGVETTQHGLMLLILGCEQAQGYGIAKPMPATDIPTWLARYSPNQQWIDFAKTAQSVTESKQTLFTLITEQWNDKFIANIQATPDQIQHWPVMDHSHCHCSNWLSRAEQEKNYEPTWRKTLYRIHESYHSLADTIQHHYLDGELATARQKLPELNTLFDEMKSMFTTH